MGEKKSLLSFLGFTKRDSNTQKAQSDGEKQQKQKMSFKNKLSLCVVGVLVLLIVGIFLSSFNSSASTKKSSTASRGADGLKAKAYVEYTETRLTSLLSSIKGISNVEVFISVSASPKIIYAVDQTQTENGSSKTTTTSIVLSKDGTLTTPVVVIEEYPEIKGVLIVAKGAGAVKTKLALSDAISVVLGVPTSCIQILEGK